MVPMSVEGIADYEGIGSLWMMATSPTGVLTSARHWATVPVRTSAVPEPSMLVILLMASLAILTRPAPPSTNATETSGCLIGRLTGKHPWSGQEHDKIRTTLLSQRRIEYDIRRTGGPHSGYTDCGEPRFWARGRRAGWLQRPQQNQHK